MRMRAVEVLVMGSLLLPACTLVLGMERAELDEGGGGAPPGTGGRTSSASGKLRPCLTFDAENACLEHCAPERAACLEDAECRLAVFDYELCLGGECSESEMSFCYEESLILAESATARDLGNCLIRDCSQLDVRWQGGAPFDVCEAHCACMEQKCSHRFDSREKCLADCRFLEAHKASCRTEHCELATEDLLHCDHAAGIDDLCDVATPDRICLDRSDRGGPCTNNDDDQCCDGLVCEGFVCR